MTFIPISIHALREEGDLIGKPYIVQHIIFLSTPSARRATFWALSTSAPRSVFLSTPSARRETYLTAGFSSLAKISIHALREEGDG